MSRENAYQTSPVTSPGQIRQPRYVRYQSRLEPDLHRRLRVCAIYMNIEVQPGMTARRDFLRGLPASTHEYEFMGKKDMRAKIDSVTDENSDGTGSEWIIFNHVPPTYPCHPANEKMSKMFKEYDSSLQSLLIKLPLGPLEIAVGEFVVMLIEKTLGYKKRGLKLIGTGRADVHWERGVKHGEATYEPKSLPSGRSRHWPSLVIENGFAQSREKLDLDCMRWLSGSNGDVKTVISICVSRDRKKIVYDRWELQQRAISTRRSSPGGGTPAINQRVSVSSPKSNRAIRVDGAPLIIPFESLYLREKVPDNDESDVVIPREDFELMAASIWEEMDLRELDVNEHT